MHVPKLKSLLFLPLLLLFSAVLHAEPMYIGFSDMINKCKTIVVADFIGTADSAGPFGHFRYNLKVEQVLRGKVTGDTLTVGRASGEVQVSPGDRCIAFINERGEFEWVGRIKKGQDIGKSVIFMEGFYDYNAYIVAPCTITLTQLKEYLATKQYHTTIAGNLYFFSDETKQLEASPVHFDIRYTFREDDKGTTEVKSSGMTVLDFPQKPFISLGAWENRISLIYEENLVRPLQIEGEIDETAGLDSSGSGYSAKFWVKEPHELTEKMFYRFLADSSVGYTSYVVDVVTPKKTYTLKLDEEGGRIGYMEGDGAQKEITSRGDPEPDRVGTIEFEYKKNFLIEMATREHDTDREKFTSDSFIRMLRIAPLKATLKRDDGKNTTSESCTIVYRKTVFQPNGNYKKKKD